MRTFVSGALHQIISKRLSSLQVSPEYFFYSQYPVHRVHYAEVPTGKLAVSGYYEVSSPRPLNHVASIVHVLTRPCSYKPQNVFRGKNVLKLCSSIRIV